MALLFRTESSLPLLQTGWPLGNNKKGDLHGSKMPIQEKSIKIGARNLRLMFS